VAEHCGLFVADLTLFSFVVVVVGGGGCRAAALGFAKVAEESRDLGPALAPLSLPLSVAALLSTRDGGKTGPCSSGGGDVTLLALDMVSGRVLDDSRRADDADSPPPLMKFSSLSTHASW